MDVATLGLVLSSTRRVTKGPVGARSRPSGSGSWSCDLKGWAAAADGREVGVSRTCAANWSRRYKVYRDGQVVKVVQRLDRLVAWAISPRPLSQDEQIQLAELRQQCLSVHAVAAEIGRAASTTSRELRGNVHDASGTARLAPTGSPAVPAPGAWPVVERLAQR